MISLFIGPPLEKIAPKGIESQRAHVAWPFFFDPRLA